MSLSSKWIESSQRLLDRINRLQEQEGKDRLDHVRSIRLMLGALQRSLAGWLQWVVNPDIMTKFSKDELEEMEHEISEFTRSFIQYDLEVTEKGAEKGLEARRKVERRRRKPRERRSGFYV